MTENYGRARKALDIRLAAYQSDHVAWKNTDYTPVNGIAYLRTHFMPAEPSQAGLGATGRNRLRGIYQVDVVHPIGGGAGPAAVQVDAIISHFKRGTQLTYDGLVVRVDRVWPGPDMDDENWFTIPVSIRWFADAPNT